MNTKKTADEMISFFLFFLKNETTLLKSCFLNLGNLSLEREAFGGESLFFVVLVTAMIIDYIFKYIVAVLLLMLIWLCVF